MPQPAVKSSSTCSLLLDLPIISKDAFTRYNTTYTPQSFKEYLAQPEDIGPDMIAIKTDPTPNIIRILFGRVGVTQKRKLSEKDIVITKRPKYTHMQRSNDTPPLSVAGKNRFT